MREVIWLNSAVKDTVPLRDFIVENNPNAVQKAAGALKNAILKLRENPLVGKPLKELPTYRDLLARFAAGGYVLRYRIHGDAIYIVHVRTYREEEDIELLAVGGNS